MRISCWIIDDEPLAINLLASYAEKTDLLEVVGKFSNAIDAVEELKNSAPDIIFLDIQMPEMDGVEFSKIVPITTGILFTTAFREFAIEGYRINAIDYLLKPVSYNEFYAATQKALEWKQLTSPKIEKENNTSKEKAIFVKSEYRLVQIFLDDILYVEGLKDYVKIYLSNKRKPTVTLMSMKNMTEILPANIFARVHRSFIVNSLKIDSIRRNMIYMEDKEIPIGETYRQKFMDSLEN